MPLAEFSGTLGKKRAAHLLRRATFGATKQQIDLFSTYTPLQAINALYHQSLTEPLPPIDLKTGQEWVTAGVTGANSKDDQLSEYFKGWFIAQMLNPSLAYSAREKLVFFLHTHFTAIQSKIASSRALYFQNKLYRLFALDGIADPTISFKELTKKVSVDNAMIRLLDGFLNVKGNPNENYARELLELYSIGRGLEGSQPAGLPNGDYGVYTEGDVQAAAKVLSGWNNDDDFNTPDIDTTIPRGKVKGSPTVASAHDNTVKVFSAHFNSTEIVGADTSEASALDEISQLIDMIYTNPETAKNICRKIYRFFVWAPHSNEDVLQVETDAINTMAQTFTTNNFKIQPVIENLLSSLHFYDNATATDVVDDKFGSIIKSPLDLVLGTLRFFEKALPDMTTSTANFYEQTGYLIGQIKAMGMDFFEPYDVAGYDAYHQFPIYNRSWITPNTLATRYKYIERLINAITPEIINVDVYSWVTANIDNTTAADANALIIEIANYLFPVQHALTFTDAADDNSGLTSQRLSYFKFKLLQGFTEQYWSDLWPSPELRSPLNELFNGMLQSPEYQLL